MEKGAVVIRWLDSTGHPLRFGESPTCDAVPRT
jgi:hypothetical protein